MAVLAKGWILMYTVLLVVGVVVGLVVFFIIWMYVRMVLVGGRVHAELVREVGFVGKKCENGTWYLKFT